MSEPEVIELSDDAAVIYERDFVPLLFGEWGPKMADAANIGPGDRVLDVGCGTGVFAREAASRVGPKGHVTGIDLNESMLAVAKRMRPEIDWRLGDATTLPFDDESFDVVGSQFVLMFIADRVGFVKEMWRTVAPGGRLAVAVWMAFERQRELEGLEQSAASKHESISMLEAEVVATHVASPTQSADHHIEAESDASKGSKASATVREDRDDA